MGEHIYEVFKKLADRIIEAGDISREEAEMLMATEEKDLPLLFHQASRIREHFFDDTIELCSIVNAKSKGCSQNCRFCSQSAFWNTNVEAYPLLPQETILEHAEKAFSKGAVRFSMVTTGLGMKGHEDDFEKICDTAGKIVENFGKGSCVSLGNLSADALEKLKAAGVTRIHHNLETSRSYFPNVCTTSDYEDKIEMIHRVKAAGLETCSGVLFGMGESDAQRLEVAFDLRELEVESVPINFLNPIPGTPMEDMEPVEPLEYLKIIAVFRFILPNSDIRLCGGREVNLRDMQSWIFRAGANAMMVGNYLTTEGRSAELDLQMIKDQNLKIKVRNKAPELEALAAEDK
jgi:biotin synthase